MKDKLEFVSAVIMNEKENVLILKRKDTLALDPEKYDLCSGHMKEGEVPIQSMYREIQEELGIKQEEIKSIENIGNIKTPHKELKNTICHMYLIQIELDEKEINKRIKEVKDPEIENVQYVKNINVLRNIQKYSDFMRTIYTNEMEKIFRIVQEKLNKRKELEVKEWKEER